MEITRLVLRSTLDSVPGRAVLRSCRRMAGIGIPVIAAGVAAAVVIGQGTGPLIHACVSEGLLGIAKGAIRIVDDPNRCGPNEDPLSWNQTGPVGPQGPPGPQGPAGPSSVVASGAISTKRGFQEPLPENGAFLTIASLSATGSGVLTVPSAARLLVQGAVRLAHNNEGSDFAQCHLELAPPPPSTSTGLISSQAALHFRGAGRTMLPLVGSADVPAGAYDVLVVCSSSGGNGWSDVDVTVIAVPM